MKAKENLLDKFYPSKILVKSFFLGEIGKDKEIEKILSEPFTYLGKGRQSFVFLSKDEKYVLKFVRQDRLKLPIFYKNSFTSNGAAFEKEEKRDRWKKSYFIAYKKAKDLTGIVSMQLGDNRIKKEVVLIDLLGRSHLVPLENTAFILQKKVTLLEDLLIALRKKGEYTEVYKLFDSYLECLSTRLDQGIVNKTRRSIMNMGVCNNTVIEFDVGEWDYDSSLNSPISYNREVDRFTKHFEKWIDKNIPECKNYFVNKKKEYKK